VVEILGDFVTLALAAVILAAALIKASRFWTFVSVVRTWGLGNPVVARSTAGALIAIELLVGTAAVATTVASAGEALARLSLLALLVGLGVGQVVIRVRARGAECGCFGSPSRVGARSLIRVWALAGVAVLCLGGPAITSSMAQSGSPSWAYPAGTTTGVAASMRLSPPQRRAARMPCATPCTAHRSPVPHHPGSAVSPARMAQPTEPRSTSSWPAAASSPA